MKIINHNTKYPEFKEQYKCGEWITGHLVRMNGVYYNHSKRTITEMQEDELDDMKSQAVAAYEQRMKEDADAVIEMKEVIRARLALTEWAESNASRFENSNKSESIYYYVSHSDGHTYKIRVSGHRHPTGSMTNLPLCVIDSTDDCRGYCKMFSIAY